MNNYQVIFMLVVEYWWLAQYLIGYTERCWDFVQPQIVDLDRASDILL